MVYFWFQVDKLLKAKDDQIVQIKSERDFLSQMLEIERKRANNAVDQMLISAGQRPVTPTPSPDKSRFETLIDEASRGLALVGGEMGEEGDK